MINKEEQLNDTKNVFSGAATLALSVFIVKIIGFIYKLPLSKILSDEGMGYFNSAYTVFSFFYMLCTGGIPKAVSILVTEMDVQKRYGNSDKILAYLLKLFLIIGAVLSIFLFFCSRPISIMIGSEKTHFALASIAPSILFVAIGGVLRGYLNGRRKMASIAISEILDGVMKFILGLALALYSAGQNAPYEQIAAYAITGVSIGSLFSCSYLFATAIIAKKQFKSEQNCTECVLEGSILKRVVRIAFPITLSATVLSLSNLVDLGMIINRLQAAGLSESDAVSLFGNYTTLCVPLLNLVSALINPISAAALPSLSALYTVGKRESFEQLSKRVLTATSFITVPCALAFVFFPEEILRLLFDDSSARIAAPMLALLAPSVIFLPMLTVANTLLESAKKTHLPLFSMCIGIALKMLCSYTLIGEDNFLIYGAPISTGLCYGISLTITLVLIFKELHISFSLFSVFVKPMILAVLSLGIAACVYSLTSKGQFLVIGFIFSVILCIILYCISIFLFGKRELIEFNGLITINKKDKK